MNSSLALAKEIANNPRAYSLDQLRDAFDRLAKTRTNGGVRNSERASARLERRLAMIGAEMTTRYPVQTP